MLKTLKQPEFGRRDYYQTRRPHICICCAALFTRTLQTMHYHFKAGQVRVIPCPRMKTRWNYICRFYLFSHLFSQLSSVLNSRWLSHGFHKAIWGKRCCCMRRCLTKDRCLKDTVKNQRLPMLEKETCAIPNTCRQSNSLTEHLLFPIQL